MEKIAQEKIPVRVQSSMTQHLVFTAEENHKRVCQITYEVQQPFLDKLQKQAEGLDDEYTLSLQILGMHRRAGEPNGDKDITERFVKWFQPAYDEEGMAGCFQVESIQSSDHSTLCTITVKLTRYFSQDLDYAAKWCDANLASAIWKQMDMEIAQFVQSEEKGLKEDRDHVRWELAKPCFRRTVG